MHELALASSIVSAVEHEIARQNLPPVKAVVVRIGALSDVVPEALQFNFEAITRDTALATTQLIIEHVPLEAHCRDCHVDFQVHNLVFQCPECASGQVEVIQGEELEIAYLEVEDATESD